MGTEHNSKSIPVHWVLFPICTDCMFLSLIEIPNKYGCGCMCKGTLRHFGSQYGVSFKYNDISLNFFLLFAHIRHIPLCVCVCVCVFCCVLPLFLLWRFVYGFVFFLIYKTFKKNMKKVRKYEKTNVRPSWYNVRLCIVFPFVMCLSMFSVVSIAWPSLHTRIKNTIILVDWMLRI